MEFDGTLQLPDGKRVAVVLEVDQLQAESVLGLSWSADVIARAIEVFGNKEKALGWLRSPVAGIDDKRPLDIIGTVEGRRRVQDILGRIEHGIFG